MNRRNAIALLGALPCVLARAQDTCPNRPVRLVVPFGPGGSGDIVSRTWHTSSRSGGAALIVDNKPGATAMIGTAIVKKAPTDGYSCCTARPRASRPIPASTRDELRPRRFHHVAVDGTIPNFMLVAKDAPYKTVKNSSALPKARTEPSSRATAMPPRACRRRCSPASGVSSKRSPTRTRCRQSRT